jgi:hypothetical protein
MKVTQSIIERGILKKIMKSYLASFRIPYSLLKLMVSEIALQILNFSNNLVIW